MIVGSEYTLCAYVSCLTPGKPEKTLYEKMFGHSGVLKYRLDVDIIWMTTGKKADSTTTYFDRPADLGHLDKEGLYGMAAAHLNSLPAHYIHRMKLVFPEEIVAAELEVIE